MVTSPYLVAIVRAGAEVVGDLRRGLRPLGAELDDGRLRRHHGVGLVLGLIEPLINTLRSQITTTSPPPDCGEGGPAF